MKSNNTFVSVSLSAAVGSSKIKKLHSERIALAIKTICFCAKVKLPTSSRSWIVSLDIFKRSSAFRPSLKTLGQLTTKLDFPIIMSLWKMFSATERVLYKASSTSWCTISIPSRLASMGRLKS